MRRVSMRARARFLTTPRARERSPISVDDPRARPYDSSVVGELTKEGHLAIDAVFRALNDPTRREILRLLRSRDMTAGEIAERFPLAKSTLSGHFNVLKHAGLVVTERVGTSIVYSLNVSALEEIVAAVLALRSGRSRRKEPRR